jgi:hypothetical protein
VIIWKDFVLDDFFGPSLLVDEIEQNDQTSCRTRRCGHPSVMEDAIGNIQETGQEQRPARMVGLSSLDSVQSGTEASRNVQPPLRLRGAG